MSIPLRTIYYGPCDFDNITPKLEPSIESESLTRKLEQSLLCRARLEELARLETLAREKLEKKWVINENVETPPSTLITLFRDMDQETTNNSTPINIPFPTGREDKENEEWKNAWKRYAHTRVVLRGKIEQIEFQSRQYHQ